MFPLVQFPQLVQHFAPFFKDVFSKEAFIQFQRYISGLIVSQNKTIDGINRLFVIESRNQSSLNRLLTASPFSLKALNQARLNVLASLPGTQMKPKGVVSVDETLLTHYGQHFEQIAKLFDPATQTYVWAHNLVTIHYSDDFTDYPLLFRLWKKERYKEGKISEDGYKVACGKLEAALTGFFRRTLKTLTKRIGGYVSILRKQRENLFLFLYEEGVEPTSNRAERAIRARVIIRKTTGCNRSEKGGRAHGILARIITICHQ